MAQPRSHDTPQAQAFTCPQCRSEMHPLFLYEDREPDTWLCFACGYVEWTDPGQGRPIPPVDQ